MLLGPAGPATVTSTPVADPAAGAALDLTALPSFSSMQQALDQHSRIMPYTGLLTQLHCHTIKGIGVLSIDGLPAAGAVDFWHHMSAALSVWLYLLTVSHGCHH